VFGRCLVLSALLHLIPLAMNPKVTIRPRERLVVRSPLVLLERVPSDRPGLPALSGLPARALPPKADSPPRPQPQPVVLTANTAEGEEKTVEFWMLEQQPLVLKRVLPVYPEAARAAMVEGRVEVRLLLDRSGRVERVVQVTGPEGLRAAAAEAACQWVFAPATQNGQPVKVWVSLPFTFRLEEHLPSGLERK
jgi:protein TonB